MNHGRHLGIYSIPYYMHVTLIGAGGIGAMTALVLAKMGVNFLDIFDPDRIGVENLATQLHKVSDVGKSKVLGLADTLFQFSDEVRINPTADTVDENTAFGNSRIVISAVDSITARKAIWQAVLRNGNAEWYLDTRMAAEVFQMDVVNMSSYTARNHYNGLITPLNEEDVPDVVCTEKATFFTASMAAGHVGVAVKRIVTDDPKSYQVIHYIAKNVLYEMEI